MWRGQRNDGGGGGGGGGSEVGLVVGRAKRMRLKWRISLDGWMDLGED